MLLNLIASCLFACAVGVGSTTNDSPYLNAKKYASYDDAQYKITLTADEVNDNVFNNLNTYLITLSNLTGTSMTYNDTNQAYNQLDISTQAYLVYGSIYFNEEGDNKFYYTTASNPLEYSLTWNLNATVYEGIKQAIELDIQANTESDYSQFATDAIDLLVGSIGGIATGIGTGLSSLISYLAISGTSMSPFMAVVFVLGGIALAFGLSRWVVNLLTSLGQRNR